MSIHTKAFLVALALAAVATFTVSKARAQEGTTHVVQVGDTCWDLAATFAGGGYNYPMILASNPGIQQTPSNKCLFYPGDRVVIPPVTSVGTVPTTGNALNPASPSIPPALGPASASATASTGGGFGSWDLHLSWPLLIILVAFAFTVGMLWAALAIGYVLGRRGLMGSFNGAMTYNFNHTFHQEGTTRHEEHMYLHDVEEHVPAKPSMNGHERQPSPVHGPVDPEH